MRTREWKSIVRKLTVEAFGEWLKTQPDEETYCRRDVAACPLHHFVQDVAKESLAINSPNMAEHWAERETQEWPLPEWMCWMLTGIDNSGEGRVSAKEVKELFSIGKANRWNYYSKIYSRQEFEKAVRSIN